MFFFFFSSRRRHTRCYRDWSSDVCSSDLRAEDQPADLGLLSPVLRVLDQNQLVADGPGLEHVRAGSRRVAETVRTVEMHNATLDMGSIGVVLLQRLRARDAG